MTVSSPSNPTEAESTSKPVSERGVLDVLRELRAGTLPPDQLSIETRRACVSYLHREGGTAEEIAPLVGVSERSVYRDLDNIRKENALVVDEGFAAQVAGELVREARASIRRIRRVAGAKQTSASVQIEGEKSCFDVLDRMVARLQSLGYLPSATQRVQAELTHHLAATPNLDDLEAEVRRLSELPSATTRSDPALDQLETVVSGLRRLESTPESKAPCSDQNPAEPRVSCSNASRQTGPSVPSENEEEGQR